MRNFLTNFMLPLCIIVAGWCIGAFLLSLDYNDAFILSLESNEEQQETQVVKVVPSCTTPKGWVECSSVTLQVEGKPLKCVHQGRGMSCDWISYNKQENSNETSNYRP